MFSGWTTSFAIVRKLNFATPESIYGNTCCHTLPRNLACFSFLRKNKPAPRQIKSSKPMIAADLYLNKIDFFKYLPGTDCKECGELSCAAFAGNLKGGNQTPSNCTSLTDNQIRAFHLALQGKKILPQVPALDLPRPGTTGLVEINHPGESSLILISGNSEFTQEVLTSIMAYTLSPYWLLFVDCRGDTVDMAMIYQSLQVANIMAALEESPIQQEYGRRELVLPGFAFTLKEPLEEQTKWRVKVGPFCIAELPMFLGDDWEVPADFNLG